VIELVDKIANHKLKEWCASQQRTGGRVAAYAAIATEQIVATAVLGFDMEFYDEVHLHKTPGRLDSLHRDEGLADGRVIHKVTLSLGLPRSEI
jgi:hypothetical protein